MGKGILISPKRPWLSQRALHHVRPLLDPFFQTTLLEFFETRQALTRPTGF